MGTISPGGGHASVREDATRRDATRRRNTARCRADPLATLNAMLMRDEPCPAALAPHGQRGINSNGRVDVINN